MAGQEFIVPSVTARLLEHPQNIFTTTTITVPLEMLFLSKKMSYSLLSPQNIFQKASRLFLQMLDRYLCSFLIFTLLSLMKFVPNLFLFFNQKHQTQLRKVEMLSMLFFSNLLGDFLI